MRYDPNKHHRRSIRLRGYDYSTPGAYFVTVCIQGRACLFGEVRRGEMQLNDAGEMIRSVWGELPQRYPAVALDMCVVMPNHFHAVATLVDLSTNGVRIGDVVGAWKSLTTNAYISGVRNRGWPPFDRRLWQRNYYERVIRDDAGLARIRAYIHNNPARWQADLLHPTAATDRFVEE